MRRRRGGSLLLCHHLYAPFGIERGGTLRLAAYYTKNARRPRHTRSGEGGGYRLLITCWAARMVLPQQSSTPTNSGMTAATEPEPAVFKRNSSM